MNKGRREFIGAFFFGIAGVIIIRHWPDYEVLIAVLATVIGCESMASIYRRKP